MDLRGDKPNQHYQESKSVGGVDLREKLNQQRQQRNKFGVVQGRGGVSGKNGPGRNNYHQQQQQYHHVQNNGPPPGRNYQAQCPSLVLSNFMTISGQFLINCQRA